MTDTPAALAEVREARSLAPCSASLSWKKSAVADVCRMLTPPPSQYKLKQILDI